MISTVVAQARHTRKSKSARRDGFRAHVAAEPGTGLITDCEMTMAAGEGSGDAENGVTMATRDRFGGRGDGDEPAGGGQEIAGLEIYGDSHYGTGQARADYQEAGHDTVIKPVPLRPAVAGGFTLDDFAISEEDGTVTCPAGHTRTISTKRYATFGAVCAAARYGHNAPPPKTAGAWRSTRTKACCAPPAPRPARGNSGRPTQPGR